MVACQSIKLYQNKDIRLKKDITES